MSSLKNLVSSKKKESNSQEDAAKRRMTHYSGLLLNKDIMGLMEALFEDMDKEAILEEVATERKKHPDWTPEMFAEAEINSTAKIMSGVALTGGFASIVPGGSLLAAGGEIISLFIFQSRLVVKIACYFDKDLTSKERITDILIGIAGTGIGAGGTVVGKKAAEVALKKAAEKATQKMSQKAAEKMGAAAGKSIPVIGAAAGVIGGGIGAVINFYAIKSVGEITIRRYGGKTDALEKLDAAVMDVAIMMALADGKVSEEERQLFHLALQGSCLSDEVKKQKELSLETGLIASEIEFDVKKTDRPALVEMAINMAMADNKLDGKEKEVLYAIGKKCSIKAKMIDSMIVSKLQELSEIKEILSETE